MDHAVIQPVFCEVLICQSSVSPTAADLAKFIFRKGLDEPSYSSKYIKVRPHGNGGPSMTIDAF
jgi:hypothetical protein